MSRNHEVVLLGDVANCPFGIDTSMSRQEEQPVATIGETEPYWYLTPDELREIADNVERAYEERDDT